jgi:NAD(P)-dependent dehydrogenase (short-subunit alcohol dehydrogenase family)
VSARSRFAGRGVIVTGAAQGIGRAIVEAFVVEGARVAAIDVRADRMSALPAGVEGIVADLADPDAARAVVPEAVRRLGAVDVLVNDAGVQPDGDALGVSVAEFDTTFAVNTRAPFLLMQDVCRHLIERGVGGAIVNVASANALRSESPESIYNASKAALVALTRAFAHEFGHLGIRVNAVCPGETITPEARDAMTADDHRLLSAYLRRVPMRRVGRADEQAAAVLFLASDEASFITGETLLVDGGELTGEWYDAADSPPVP